MSNQGKLQLTIVFKAPTPEIAAEGDHLFTSHAAWMENSHPREGDLALVSYDVSKGPEFVNPLDASQGMTGATYFVLTEIYETQAGVDNHWKMGSEEWADFAALVEWMGRCRVDVVHGTPVIHSLW